MRALCGAIITAGALIGLGLTALGTGIRYQGMGTTTNPTTDQIYAAPTLTISLVTLLAAAAIGLGLAFVGLALHTERRYFERAHGLGGEPPIPTP